MRTLWGVLLVAAVVATACGSATSAAPAATVTTTLTDKAIAVDQTSVANGTVTFKVVNAGTVVHSLVVLKTSVPHDKIAADPKDASRVDQTGAVRETGQIAVGGSKDLSVKLAPGSYVLVCNEPAHYAIGMHIPFNVK